MMEAGVTRLSTALLPSAGPVARSLTLRYERLYKNE